MKLLSKIFSPLQKGKAVKNPADMKEWQNAISVVTAIGALIIALIPSLEPYLNADVVMKAFSAYAAINVYLTTASSDKVGL